MHKRWMGALRPGILILSLQTLSTGCVPQFLEKYRQRSPTQEIKPGAAANKKLNRQSVVMVDPGTVRFQASYEKVWD